MRWLGRAILVSAIVAILFGVLRLSPVQPWRRPPQVETLSAPLVAQAQRSIAYPLPAAGWLSFPLKPGGGSLRLLSNARLAPDTPGLEPSTTPPSWSYTLEYRLLDTEDQVLGSGTGMADFESAVRHGRLADGTTQRLLHGERSTQALTEERYYFLADPGPRAARLLVRAVQAPAPLDALLIRVYQRERLTSQRSGTLWARLSSETRERLGEISVHGAELLDERERQALLRWRWGARAPLGIEGRDYASLQLYQLGPDLAAPIESDAAAIGWPLGPGSDAVLSLPVEAHNLSVLVTPLATATPATEADADLAQLHWYGRPAIRQERWTIPLGETFRTPIESGTLVVSAQVPARVRVWIGGPDDRQELTLESLAVRAWQIEGDDALAYDIAHADRRPTPWRLDVRALAAADDPTALPVELEYRWLDRDDLVVHRGRWVSRQARSRHEYPSQSPELQCGEVESLYFSVPPNAVRLELRTAHPVAIAAYNRPWALPRRSLAPVRPSDQSLPDWFGVRPLEWRERQRDNRSLSIRLQPSPPELDPRLLAGDLHWESFLPEGRWRGRELLLPATPGEVRRRALGLYYLELKPGAEQRVHFDSLAGPVNPQLLYSRTQDRPAEAQVRLDGERVARLDLRARAGAFDLESIAPGPHRLRIDGPDDLHLFVNQVREAFDAQSSGWLRRLAIELDEAPLSFSLTKSEAEELLALRWYAPVAQREPQRLRVRIAPLSAPHRPTDGDGATWGPFRDWTFPEHELRLGPAPASGRTRPARTAPEPLDDGTLTFIKMSSG